MNRSILVIGLLLLCGLCLIAGRLSSQDKPGKPLARPGSPAAKGKEPSPAIEVAEELDEVAKKWLAFRTPGAPHKRLEALVGKWDYRLKLWTKADAPPGEFSGVTEIRWVLGNRFVQMESSGKFLDLPFNSLWLLGYDNNKKKYVSCYLDNVGTGLYPAEGSTGPGENAITLVTHMDDWYSGEHGRAFSYVIRTTSRDAWMFEMTDVASGERTMEVTYTRQK
jgi:uncharacterized protein DUF1579